MELSQSAFARLVRRALADLPPDIAQWLDNVEVIVEDRPSRDQLRSLGMGPGESLLGLYEGTPLTGRGVDYGMVVPDRVTIFREPLLASCTTRRELRAEVRRTVVHELAHHFGIDDDRLEELGAY